MLLKGCIPTQKLFVRILHREADRQTELFNKQWACHLYEQRKAENAFAYKSSSQKNSKLLSFDAALPSKPNAPKAKAQVTIK